MPKLEIVPLHTLFEPSIAVPPELLKEAVVKDLKQTEFIGVPDADLRISFSPSEGCDILVQRIDPENALGYSVYSDEEDYFNHLQSELYEPTDDEILGGIGE